MLDRNTFLSGLDTHRNCFSNMYCSAFVFASFTIFCGITNAFPQTKNNNGSAQADKKAAAGGLLAFTVDLLKTLHHAENDKENLIFSPVSIYAALSLAYLGAAGSTRKEIGKVLRSPEDNNEFEKFHENIGDILESIQRRPERVLAEARIANGLFVKKDLEIKSSYKSQSSSFYKTEIVKVDFANEAEAVGSINKWVAEKTNGRIPQLMKDTLDPDTLTLLASSLYFNGRWSEHFYSVRTKTEKFFTGSKQIDVPMMHNEDTIPYLNNPSLQFESIILEYDGGDFSMGLILPYANQSLMNLTDHLKPENIQQIFDEENYISVDYKIPRMKFSSSISLKETLTTFGMQNAFNAADFSNLVEGKPVKIADVKHAAEIEVDEDGTKASAITAVQLVLLSGKVVIHPIKFYVDRPFLVLIHHRPTSTILFASAVHKPINN